MHCFILADATQCIGCRTCEVACAVSHQAQADCAALSPATFQARLQVEKTASVSVPVMCRQCEDAPCARVCPTGTLVHGTDYVAVTQAACIGCKTCMVVCPYGAIRIATGEESRVNPQVLKCDLCQGRDAGPACVEACPTGALRCVSGEALEALTRQRRLQAAASPLSW